jgi:hypothetical protein
MASPLPPPPITGPDWARTVAGLLEVDAAVTAFCSSCGGVWRKDRRWLERLAQARGPGFSLWGSRPRCWTRGCPDRLFFRASCAPGTPSIRLEDRYYKKGRRGEP